MIWIVRAVLLVLAGGLMLVGGGLTMDPRGMNNGAACLSLLAGLACIVLLVVSFFAKLPFIG